jgi:hypothetical protein
VEVAAGNFHGVRSRAHGDAVNLDGGAGRGGDEGEGVGGRERGGEKKEKCAEGEDVGAR